MSLSHIHIHIHILYCFVCCVTCKMPSEAKGRKKRYCNLLWVCVRYPECTCKVSYLFEKYMLLKSKKLIHMNTNAHVKPSHVYACTLVLYIFYYSSSFSFCCWLSHIIVENIATESLYTA